MIYIFNYNTFLTESQEGDLNLTEIFSNTFHIRPLISIFDLTTQKVKYVYKNSQEYFKLSD
jgi:hypothetical protein